MNVPADGFAARLVARGAGVGELTVRPPARAPTPAGPAVDPEIPEERTAVATVPERSDATLHADPAAPRVSAPSAPPPSAAAPPASERPGPPAPARLAPVARLPAAPEVRRRAAPAPAAAPPAPAAQPSPHVRAEPTAPLPARERTASLPTVDSAPMESAPEHREPVPAGQVRERVVERVERETFHVVAQPPAAQPPAPRPPLEASPEPPPLLERALAPARPEAVEPRPEPAAAPLPVVVRPPAPPPLPRTTAGKTPAPPRRNEPARLEIGTIEVRLDEPAPSASATPARAPAPSETAGFAEYADTRSYAR